MKTFVCICLFLLVFASSAVADAWTHRAAITVNNAGGMVTDYTLRVSFGAANPELFDLSLANGADWRFRKKDGLTTLNHWMEWWSTDPDTAIALVKLDTLKPGADSIYLYFGNPSATSTSNGTATCQLFQDFNTDFTVSGVTDILHMQGLGVDSFRRIVMDTCMAENQRWRREEGNVLCNTIPGVPDSLKYLHIYSAGSPIVYQNDSSWMYLETSSDGFTFTRRGRLDTLGGKASCDSAHGEDAYTIIYHDTLWTYYEYKGDYVPPCSRNPKCDRIGLCYSADNGLSWTFAGKVVDDSSTKFTWLISPSSPAAIVWDTSEVAYPDRKHNIYLAVEVKGYFPGYVDCGGGMLALFGADHPLGVYDTVHCYPCSTALPTSFYRAAVPNQLFNISDSLYVDAHCMHGPSSSWLHGRFRLSDDLQSLSSVRYFSNDSMLAGAIISQDILRDSSWMAWILARNMPGTGVRYRTMFTNPNAVPSGWRGFRRNSNFGFHEAKNGQLLLAAEPFRVDSGFPSIALISDTGFTNNFVIETRMKLKWDTLSPAAVISAGSGQPASLTGYYSASAEMGMNSGYGIRYTNSAYYGNLFYLKPDSASKKLASEIIPDSLENTWRIHHLAYSGDTLRWWADGSASSLRPKAYTVLYKAGAKRIMLASGEGSARYGVNAPRGSQMAVDWLLVRKYQYPEPTITFGDVQAIPPQPTVVVQEEDGYVRLNWTNTGAPSYRVLCSTTLGGPYSLLFSTGDTTATVVRIDTAATGCFYQVVSASE